MDSGRGERAADRPESRVVTDAQFSQVGIEAWVANPTAVRQTQVGIELWRSTATGNTNMVATQVGLEVWTFLNHSTFVPPPYFCWIE